MTYSVKFENTASANNYIINDIPFTGTIAPDNIYPRKQNIRCKIHGKKIKVVNGKAQLVNNYDGLVFKSNGQMTVTLNNVGGNMPSIFYSLDYGKTWLSYTTSILLKSNTLLYFKGINSSGLSRSDEQYSYFSFSGTGTIEAYGNIMSLIDDGACTALSIPGQYCFYKLFSGCTKLTSAPEVLPATTLNSHCYERMFEGCTSLVNAPELPAINLEPYCYAYMFSGCNSLITTPTLSAAVATYGCYYYMFENCTALRNTPELPAMSLFANCYHGMFHGCRITSAPELPATTLASDCYKYMFSECKLLTKAPELPATILQTGCYAGMFEDCISLTKAPELPAPTLVTECYQEMFYKCNSLRYIKCLATDISATDCTNDWVYNVATSGTFVKASIGTDWPTSRGLFSSIPVKWSILVNNDYVKAELIEGSSFKFKLSKLSSNSTLQYKTDTTVWTTATADLEIENLTEIYLKCSLNADNSTDNYTNIRLTSGNGDGKVKLTGYIDSLLGGGTAGILHSYKYSGCKLFMNSTAIKDISKLQFSLDLTQYCYYSMFYGCTTLVSGPNSLPAQPLQSGCYYNMFYGCTSLIAAPELPATSLVSYCYRNMFYGCKSLTYIKCLATSGINSNYSTTYWVSGVNNNGLFIKNSSATWPAAGENSIPANWTVRSA